MPEVQELMADKRVYLVQPLMCHWGMKSQDDTGCEGLVCKAATWMTSSPVLAEILQQICANMRGGVEHRHVHLVGGKRASFAAEHPPKLARAAMKGFERQMEL